MRLGVLPYYSGLGFFRCRRARLAKKKKKRKKKRKEKKKEKKKKKTSAFFERSLLTLL